MPMENKIIIRPMEDADIPAVVAIEQAAYRAPWSEILIRDCVTVGLQCWVLETEQQIVAYGIMAFHEGECHLLNLCVDPKRQRQYYASRLLDFLLHLTHKSEISSMFLEVRPSNTAAVNLYKKKGFIEAGIMENYYRESGEPEDALVLRIEL